VKVFGEAAMAAIEAGEAMGVGAVFIGCAPNPVRVWSGYGQITIDGQVFEGIGDRGLVTASGGGLGGAAQDVTLSLSGVEPANLALLDAAALKDSPVIIWRLIFDTAGQTLLAATVFTRGRLDTLNPKVVPGGTATLEARVEGAAKGLGRSRGRTRSDTDQRLDAPDDAGFSATSYAGQKTIYLGGKIPATVSTLPGIGGVTSNSYDDWG